MAGGLRAAQSLGASRRQLLWRVVLPTALPDILTGLRIGLGAGWSTLVAAELVAATRGLGFMVQSAAQFLVTDMVLTGITNAMVQAAPPAAQVMTEAARFVGDTPMVAHNASFDRRYWQAELALCGLPAPQPYACTVLLSRRHRYSPCSFR